MRKEEEEKAGRYLIRAGAVPSVCTVPGRCESARTAQTFRRAGTKSWKLTVLSWVSPTPSIDKPRVPDAASQSF